MKRTGFVYKIKVSLKLTRQEVTDLITVAEAHYDSKCKAAAHRGGFLYGLRNYLDGDEEVTCDFWAREINLMCKILEQAANPGMPETARALWYPMREAMVHANEEFVRLNGDPP